MMNSRWMNMNKTFMVFLSILFFIFQGANEKLEAKLPSYVSLPRDYYATVTSHEKSDITYILRTVANSSLIKLASSKSSLEKAGDRINHLHPLSYFLCVFTDEELKVCMRNLQGRSWVWKEFLDGVTDSLAKENQVGNLKYEYVQDLATKVNVDVNILYPSIQAGRWVEFINLLIAYVPRKEGANRYDMHISRY